MINYSFSSKPASGYVDYYEKITTYANILSSQAAVSDSSVTHKTRPVIIDDDEESVFHYMDDASAKLGSLQSLPNYPTLKSLSSGLAALEHIFLISLLKPPFVKFISTTAMISCNIMPFAHQVRLPLMT